MSPRDRAAEAEETSPASVNGSASYVYGIVPTDVEVEPGTEGVGQPAGEVRLVPFGQIAALVSDVEVDRPLGRPKDLQAHQRLLDQTAAEVPVLPFRFGAVLTDSDAVVEELLKPYHDQFADALQEVEGRTQYVVNGRYDEQAILREILRENGEAADLRQQIAGLPEDATRNERMRLGEIIEGTIADKREVDTAAVVDELSDVCEQLVVREPAHERDAAHVAALVERGKTAEFEQAVDELTRRWSGRVEVRLLGPMAPYDFVGTS
ncbi:MULTISPECIES: GvpL/GvpF family gas vesicle protein [unclassified Nonomuraea]|uniref:GvpL/GvpF family gas vesicle protein n=1 Tax=Nonomuraea sp. NPDC047529 TaxID=3155623 RepID=UPI0033FED7BB